MPVEIHSCVITVECDQCGTPANHIFGKSSGLTRRNKTLFFDDLLLEILDSRGRDIDEAGALCPACRKFLSRGIPENEEYRQATACLFRLK